MNSMVPDTPAIPSISTIVRPSEPPAIVYSAKIVIPVTAPAIADGAVAVRGGRVLHVGTRRWVMDELEQQGIDTDGIIERHWDGVLMPGLINAHTHLQYTGMAAVGSSTYSDFHSWELAFDQAYEQAQESAKTTVLWRRWAFAGARQLVETGTTAAADIVTDFGAAGALASQGLHGIAYWEVMNWRNRDWESEGRKDLRQRLHALESLSLPSIGISPHAPYTLDSEPFVDLPDIARHHNMRLHIHLAETPLEAGSHPLTLTTYSSKDWSDERWANYRELKERGRGASAIQFVDRLGCLGPDVHIAHGVWANREDRRILRQRGVAVALCPRSNRITHTGKDAPVRNYLDEGNILALGTDSLSSSPSLDLFDETATLYALAREQGYEQADLSHRIIRMMTLGGAEAMGLNVGADRIGQINAGALADLAFIDVPVDVATPEGIEHTFDTLVTEGSGRARATVIAGRLAFNEGAFDAPEQPIPAQNESR